MAADSKRGEMLHGARLSMINILVLQSETFIVSSHSFGSKIIYKLWAKAKRTNMKFYEILRQISDFVWVKEFKSKF